MAKSCVVVRMGPFDGDAESVRRVETMSQKLSFLIKIAQGFPTPLLKRSLLVSEKLCWLTSDDLLVQLSHIYASPAL